MPVSEKEIIERLPDWIAEKKTSFLFGSGTSAPGMPLMNMFPGKKDGSTDVDGLMYEIIKRNKFLIGAKMKINVSEEESKAILGTLGAYKKFIEILLDMLGNVNARERHKNINIFTTNYDLFIEKAVDDIYESGSTAPFIFNDGARGYFNRLLDNSNFDTTTAYKGRFDNYINELPSINLAKIHGSVNWKKQSEDMIRVCNYVVRDKPEKRETVKPDGNEPKATTYEQILLSIQDDYKICKAAGKKLYHHLWIYTHGIATLCATKMCRFTDEEISTMITEVCMSILKKLKEGENND